jgi:DNA-binding transcriptional regulator YiaG
MELACKNCSPLEHCGSEFCIERPNGLNSPMNSTTYRAIRKSLALSQLKLAEILDVHWTSISRREGGKAEITKEAELAILQLKSTLKTKEN